MFERFQSIIDKAASTTSSKRCRSNVIPKKAGDSTVVQNPHQTLKIKKIWFIWYRSGWFGGFDYIFLKITRAAVYTVFKLMF